MGPARPDHSVLRPVLVETGSVLFGTQPAEPDRQIRNRFVAKTAFANERLLESNGSCNRTYFAPELVFSERGASKSIVCYTFERN